MGLRWIANAVCIALAASDCGGIAVGPEDGGAGSAGSTAAGGTGAAAGSSAMGGMAGEGGQAAAGKGGSSAQCAPDETCQDVSGGDPVKTYACTKSDPSLMTLCTNGPFGLGCPSDQMCVESLDTWTTACVSKKIDMPPDAAPCASDWDCKPGEVCVTTIQDQKSGCIVTGCTAASCTGGALELYATGTDDIVDLCVCGLPCNP
jgi:hypothetical protein